MKIDTTDNSNDTQNRVAAIFLSPDKQSFLTGRAPNRKDRNDFVGKGHIELGEDPLTTLKREAFEEANIDLDEYQVLELTSVPYQKGTMFFYVIPLVEIPELKCNCVFDWYGRKLPEFSRFDWIPLNDWKGKLYKSLEAVCEPVFAKLQSQIENGLI